MSSENPRIVLLAGIPSVRKSGFGAWARAHRGVAHIDAEHEWAPDMNRFRVSWAHGDPARVASFVEALRVSGRPVIFDWGFPVRSLPTVRAFHSAGTDLWWLDGDRAAARTIHSHAPGKSVQRFDDQVKDIDDAWPTITQLFPATRRLSVLSPAGEFLDYATIYEAIFGS